MIKKNNKRKIVMLIISILCLMVLIVFLVGKSFGFFQYIKKGEVVNVITIKGLAINIDETTIDSLNITNTFPMSDSDGLEQSAFVFTINNTSSKAMDYSLKLLNDDEKQSACFTDSLETNPCTLLPYQYIRYSYSINDGEYSNPANLTEDGRIYSETISENGQTKLAIKLWVDSKAPNSIQGNTFFGKLVLVGGRSIFASDLPSVINLGDSYDISINAQDGEVITCTDDDNNTIVNTEYLNLGRHIISCSLNNTDEAVTKIITVEMPVEYFLNEKILADNNSTSDIVIPDAELVNKSYLQASANYQSGLFKTTDTNGGDTYYYRGNVDNNWILFGNDYWRIVRINEDGTIRIVKQDGIDNNANYIFDANYFNLNYMYYTNSTIYQTVNNWYTNYLTEIGDYKNNLTSGTFCQSAKVRPDKYDSNAAAAPGNATMQVIESYVPSFSCPESDGNITNGKLTLPVGMITVDELLFAGNKFATAVDSYLNNGRYYWSMSPAGKTASHVYVWRIASNGNLYANNVDLVRTIRPVVNLNDGTKVTVHYDGTLHKKIYQVLPQDASL